MMFKRAECIDRRWKFSYSLLILGLVLAACSPQVAPIDLEAEERAIRQASLSWSKTERSGTHDWVPEVFWEDAVLQPPGQPQLQGHAEILAFYARVKLRDSGLTRPRFPLHISASGDLAVEWGRGSVSVEEPDGPALVRFKFVTVWERRGGIWKVRLNSWNDDPALDDE